ncbi:cation transporting ATPase C-terminal domain-containing protein [Bradyrhizobium sp. PUT101]|uniref:cation transporting ATPase C-terminal domain-containing protein n=1 Tax=Bradyrhizobium sp. PUT101 TaxID=3447427 RepID=UPI003F86F311
MTPGLNITPQGRTVYDNIKKVISWTLPTNAGEATTIIAALFLGMALPVTAVQILWINLITGITLGVALAFEPTEDDTMKRAPRSRKEPLLTGALIWHIILVSALFLAAVFGMYTYATDRGHAPAPDLARTIALNTLALSLGSATIRSNSVSSRASGDSGSASRVETCE